MGARLAILASFVFLTLASAAHAHPGDLDETFRGVGWTTVGFGDETATGQEVEIAADGSVVAVGTSGAKDPNAGQPTLLAIGVFTPRGTLDASFSGDGRETLYLGPRLAVGGFEFDSAGRMLVSASIDGNLTLLRLTPDGSLDQSFGVAGRSVVDLGAYEFAVGLERAGDGAIVVGTGSCADDSNECSYGVARFTGSGAPDISFSGDGVAIADFPGFEPRLSAVGVYPDGRILAVGRNSPFAAVARFLPSGELDRGFNGTGLSLFSEYSEGVFGVLFDGAARPLLITGRGSLLPVAEDGSIEKTLGYASSSGYALAADGQVLSAGGIGGCSRYCSPLDTAVFRSVRDDAFGEDGFARADVGRQGDDSARDLVLDSEGRMVTTGFAGSKLAVARFETAPGPRDGDADGVVDGADECPLVHALATGCPIIERSVSIHARSTQEQLAGTLDSDDQACVGREFIRVLRVRRASEKQVAKVRVRHNGRWQAAGFAPGRYRAVVRSKVRPRLGLCEADESQIERISRP